MKLHGSNQLLDNQLFRYFTNFKYQIINNQLLDISPENFTFLKTFNSEFSDIEASFTDQNSDPLEIQDKIDINLVIDQNVTHKK